MGTIPYHILDWESRFIHWTMSADDIHESSNRVILTTLYAGNEHVTGLAPPWMTFDSCQRWCERLFRTCADITTELCFGGVTTTMMEPMIGAHHALLGK